MAALDSNQLCSKNRISRRRFLQTCVPGAAVAGFGFRGLSAVSAPAARDLTVTRIDRVTVKVPFREVPERNMARELHNARGIPFLEVFVDVPLSVVQARDPKGLYKKVAEGKIKGFTGIDDPYEKPVSAEIVLDTVAYSPEENARSIIDYLVAERLLMSGLDSE